MKPRLDKMQDSFAEISAGLLQQFHRVRLEAEKVSVPSVIPVSVGAPATSQYQHSGSSDAPRSDYQTPRVESHSRSENSFATRWTPQSPVQGIPTRFFDMVDYRTYIENKAVEDFKNMEARRKLAAYEEARFSSFFYGTR